MIIIYDFDGTLTPYPLPNYPVLAKCGYDGNSIMVEVKRIMKEQSVDLFTAYFQAMKEILENNGIPFREESICEGVLNAEFNKGVLEYFDKLCYEKSGIKHYVVTSGFEDFVKETKISKYLDGVYGTNFYVKDGNYDAVNRLMSHECKIDAIEEIKNDNKVDLSNIVYFGDGLTDMNAFLHIHNNGGKAILVCPGSKENDVYKELEKLGIIDECFDLDYSEDSLLYEYISHLSKCI